MSIVLEGTVSSTDAEDPQWEGIWQFVKDAKLDLKYTYKVRLHVHAKL
jgi:hypothetical protein